MLNGDFVGFMMRITDSEITIFGDYDQRFDVPILKAREVNNILVLDMKWTEFKSYGADDFTSNHNN
ncbi:hypothetical protein BH23THE1_BH23THE1_18880 [soil metagenome]